MTKKYNMIVTKLITPAEPKALQQLAQIMIKLNWKRTKKKVFVVVKLSLK